MQNCELLERGVINICGDDANKFLQGLITNDINILNSSPCIYSFMLSPQGKYLFDFFIIKYNAGFLIDVVLNQKQALLKQLTLYKMRSHIEIQDLTDEFAIVYSSSQPESNTILYKDPRYNKLGWRQIVPKTNSFQNTLKNLYIKDKYDYAIVDGNYDMLEGRSFPIEYGAEDLNAISYTKGCYIGQELISRTKYQGVLRKIIMTAETKNPLSEDIKPRSEVMAGNKKIGELCSFWENKLILLMRKEEYLASKDERITLEENILLENFAFAPWSKT
ncbi:MAG: folate-binding protein [Rickettsiaceae bacterium]|nr:folate-binding protein [Rickettsiaceae bacterium]